MNDRSVSADGNISRSIVITGDGNHASIHLGGGVTLPLARQQRLSKRHRKPTADNLLPLLRADSLAFEVVGREQELAELRQWLDSDADISVQTLIGRAGTGKTRLGIELCRRIDGGEKPGETGWSAGFLRPADIASVVDQLATRQVDTGEPTLLVIDYASAVHRALAGWFDRLAASDFAGKLRFLLLDREAPEGFGWWHELAHPALSGHRAELFVDPDRPRVLPGLTGVEARRALFGAALKATSDLLGERVVAREAPPQGTDAAFDAALAEERFGNPLNLTMAGLIAAEGGVQHALALRRLEAARGIARREVKRMVLLGQSCGVPAATVHHSLGFNGLAGGLPIATLAADLSAELAASGLTATADELPGLLERELPRESREADDGAEPRLGTVQPDLVGEAVIIESLLVGPKSRVATTAATFQRAYALGGDRAAEALMRLLQDYGYAAEDPVASPAERKTGEDLLQLLSAVAESIPDEDYLQLEPLVSAFPHDTLILREAAAKHTWRMSRIWRAISASVDASNEELMIFAEDRSAGWLNDLANRLSDVGRQEEALEAAQEGVNIRRRLACARPDANKPRLATSLHTLAIRLSNLGHDQQALEASQESLGIRRRLAADHPYDFEPYLAMSLNNLANILGHVGQRREALDAAQEAVALYRHLVANRPAEFMPAFAMSLNNLASKLSEIGLREEALEAAQEALVIYRHLASVSPDAFTPGLAGSLNNLANRLGGHGRREEAMEAAQEAVDIRRSLAAGRPDSFEPDLARSLENLSKRLSELGRRLEALEAANEAASIFRRLAAARPGAYTPDFARSLSVLGDRLEDAGRLSEAVQLDRESVVTLAPYFVAQPRAFERAMATYLHDYYRRSEAAGLAWDEELVAPLLEKFIPMLEEQGE